MIRKTSWFQNENCTEVKTSDWLRAKGFEMKSDMMAEIIREYVECAIRKKTFLPEVQHWLSSKILLYPISLPLGRQMYIVKGKR